MHKHLCSPSFKERTLDFLFWRLIMWWGPVCYALHAIQSGWISLPCVRDTKLRIVYGQKHKVVINFVLASFCHFLSFQFPFYSNMLLLATPHWWCIGGVMQISIHWDVKKLSILQTFILPDTKIIFYWFTERPRWKNKNMQKVSFA